MDFKAGFVSILGKPNVGKSTLMNALVEERLSIITSSKPKRPVTGFLEFFRHLILKLSLVTPLELLTQNTNFKRA